MSFILDALKKSETDRQRQSGPSLFEVKVAEPRRRLPIWAVAIAVLLGINLVVVSWMLLRRPSSQQQPAPAAAATGTVSGGAAATSAATGPPATGVAPAGPRSGGGERAPAPAAAASLSTPPPAAPPAPGPANAGTQPPSAPPADGPPPSEPGASQSTAGGDPSDYAPAVEPSGTRGSAATEGTPEGGLPLYQQIVDSAGLPSLHLDLHVFADRPRDRFVMINMHRLGEGDSLPDGVQVDTIRPDGVVLSYHGTRFLLPRS